MKGKWKRWLPALRKVFLREAIVLVCAAAMGLGWSLFTSEHYLPTLDGNVYAMDPTDNSLFMVVSKDANNSLVHIDYEGNVFHYAVTETNQAFENLAILGDTIYAVLTTYNTGETIQQLVSLTMDSTAMSVHTLLDLSAMPQAQTAEITWTGAYVPLEDDPSEICLGGVDSNGNGYLLHWDVAAEHAQVEQILTGETIYKLKYVDTGRYVWIDADGRVGQYVDGLWQRDLLQGLAETPNHVSTYKEHVFIADSATGNIFELDTDGTAQLRWSGGSEIRSSGYQYEDITIFTTYPDCRGDIQVIGLCPSDHSSANVVIGPSGTISDLRMGASKFLMIFQHSWAVTILAFIFLAAVVEILRACLHSPRMVVRLALSELVMAGIMLGTVVGIQYVFYQNTIREDAQQKLQLIGGNLADVLTSEVEMSNPEVRATVQGVLNRITDSDQYTVNVVWDDDGTPMMGYDLQVPALYHIADVKSRSFYEASRSFLSSNLTRDLQEIRNDLNVREYVYMQRITQEEWIGCVTVSQSESAILSGRSNFWTSMVPILAACPFLFAALIFLTWRLLRPLNTVRESLEEFYETGGGNQMDLNRMPRTELYEVGLVFNELSRQTKVQFNTLSHINDAYTRLVPDCLCQMLQKKNVLELSPGEYAAVDGALLILVPETPARTAALLEDLFRPVADLIAAGGGMIIDYDEGLGALTAIFGGAGQAQECAKRSLDRFDDAGQRVMAAVFTEPVEFGVFGSKRMLYPLAVSGALHRRQEVLSLLLEFGAVLVQSGEADYSSLRLLGWDGEIPYYEDPSCRSSAWQAQWENAETLWAEAMSLFRSQQFPQAMRRFARVLRLVPEDAAARWYLFRCESLRDTAPSKKLDTGLLFDWGRRHG